MDGQISIFDYQDQRKREIAKRLPIPPIDKKYREAEGWCDDWHYCELEEPPVDDVYFTISTSKDSEYYYYHYKAWARGCWWHWDSWKKEFRKDYEKFYETTFAWVRIPSLYLQVDKALHVMLGMNGIIGE